MMTRSLEATLMLHKRSMVKTMMISFTEEIEPPPVKISSEISCSLDSEPQYLAETTKSMEVTMLLGHRQSLEELMMT